MVEANNVAMQFAGNFILREVRANMSFSGEKAPKGQLGRKSGRTLAGMYVKTFLSKSGLQGVSIKSHKDRAHILRYNEYGTKSHGRYLKASKGKTRNIRRIHAAKFGKSALPARLILATTWQAINSAAATIYANEFEAHFQMRMSGL